MKHLNWLLSVRRLLNMTDKNYLDEFLDTDESNEQNKKPLPSWVSESNSSLKAYEAINVLKEEKKRYIKRHGLKSQYIKKSCYQITKAEVARMVGAKPQPLFFSNAYSAALTRYFDDTNNKLEEAKQRKIAKNKAGLRAKHKDVLVKELQIEKKEKEDLLVETVDAVFERTLSKLSLDVKRKLGL